MVRIKRLTVQGFKSFPQKISIPFPSNFTAICGPNGSGKSNIVDGIMFVLGTSSTKQIRAKKLEKLIFNGGENRKAAEHCAVSMYLDNSENEIPGNDERDEVKVTRKVSKSGVSIYKLNGKTVTRSKIVDLLSQVGISPDGHNIIMQGDVTKIIEMSSTERRKIIDRISGISEFDEKKEKAEKELEKVSSKVREMMIMVSEKEKQVKKLKKEKEDAEKYQRLEKKLKIYRASLAKKRLDKATEKMETIDKKLKEKRKEFKKINESFNKEDEKLEEKEEKLEEISEELIEKSRNAKIKEKLEKLNSDLVIKRNKYESNTDEIQRIDEMINNLQSIGSQKTKAVKEILSLDWEGIYGTASSLISVPSKYSTAIEVAMGRHKNDIVVKDHNIAVRCVKHLKQHKIGRARFIPLNKINPKHRKSGKEKGVHGVASDLVKFDPQYTNAIKSLLGDTLIADNMDIAKNKKGRVVTLDGNIKERSGAIIGGYYKKKRRKNKSTGKYEKEKQDLIEENKKLEEQIANIQDEIKELEGEEREENKEVKTLEKKKDSIKNEIGQTKQKRKDDYEKKSVLQSEINEMATEKARMEARIENLKEDFEEHKNVNEYKKGTEEELKEKVRLNTIEINKLGHVNIKAIEEFKTMNTEFEEQRKKLNKLIEEKEKIEETVQSIESRRYRKFMDTLVEISRNFSKIYKDLMGGHANLRLEEKENIESGLQIEASPKGKNILDLDSMSGGEKTMTSIAFLFSVMRHYKSPFYILDEIDAALDKTNTKLVDELIKKQSKEVQFIVVTHNDGTIQEADKVIGVSMEKGVSKIFGLDMSKKQ